MTVAAVLFPQEVDLLSLQVCEDWVEGSRYASSVDLLVLKHTGESRLAEMLSFDVLENQFLEALHEEGLRATGRWSLGLDATDFSGAGLFQPADWLMFSAQDLGCYRARQLYPYSLSAGLTVLTVAGPLEAA